MLIADGPGSRLAMREPDRHLRAGAASALLHAVLLGLLLARWPGRAPPSVPPLEIELIQEQAMTPGNAPVQPKPPPPPKPEDAGLAEPKPPPPPRPPPNVNIGDGPEQRDPLTVTGDNVVPPAPDSRFRNEPPPYPADAARARAEGTVQLVIHVSAQGLPVEVRIIQSSGNESLDAAARRAVQRWRFRPALSDGHGLAFDYLMNIRFALGEHP